MKKKRKTKSWMWTAAGLGVILLCALVLRAYMLNVIPVFVDEAIYIRWAQIMRADSTLRFLPLSDGKQPLFMWAVMPALKFISDPLVAGRVVSVATGIGTTVGIFALSYVLFRSRKAALLASLLYALSPFAVFFDRMALVDSMLSMFGIWSLIFAILAVKNLRLDFAFLAGFCLGGAMLTKSPSIFFIVLLPSALLFLPLKNKNIKLDILKSVALLGVVILMGFGIYNILRLGPNFHLIGSRNFDYVYPYSRILEKPFDPLVGHLDSVISWFEVMGPTSLLVMALAGILGNFKKYKRAVIILSIWALVPIVVQSEYAKVLTSRYIFFTLPFFFILAGSILKRFKKLPYLYGVYAIVGLFIFQSFLFYVPFFRDPAAAHWPGREGYMANWTAGAGIKEVAEIIKTKRDANPDVNVTVGTEGYFGTLPDGLQIYLQNEPRIVVIGVGLGIFEIPEELVNAKLAGDFVYLVANSSRLNFTGEFSDHGLEVVASFKKAQRDEGSHNYVESGPFDTFYLLELK